MGPVIGLVLSLVCCVACVAMAKAADKNPIVWGIVGFLFPLIGLLVCYAFTRSR